MLPIRRFASAAIMLVILFCSCACSTGQASSSNIPELGTVASDISDRSILSELKSEVTAENRSDYDFTDKALAYLTIIGENYPERCVIDWETGKADESFGDFLVSELTACGYEAQQITEQRFAYPTRYGAAQGRNIILTVPGQQEGQIIAGAHYDGSCVGDNGSGTALLLATAVSLVDVRPQYTLRYIFFDGEENGKLGSRFYVDGMSDEDAAATLYMINLDALAFGDFCNIYGGVYGSNYDLDYFTGNERVVPKAEQTEGYFFAADMAEQLGFKVYRPQDLDGYFAENGHGMELQEDAFFTNPWTYENPAPANMNLMGPSPATIGASDHAPFAVRGIPYIYFEATNWWAEGTDPRTAYLGYTETYDESIGVGGQIMNTDYDTLDTLELCFPGRAEQHYRLFSPLLSSLLLVK